MSITPTVPPTYPPTAAAPVPHRHALGLPAGSIRSLLALAVLGLSWLIVLRPAPGQKEPLIAEKLPLVFIYLQMLMVLILAHFFAAHGNTIRPAGHGASPLGLPRGSVRFVLLLGYLGLAAFLYHLRPEFQYPPQGDFVLMLLLLISAFFIGHLLTGAVRMFSSGVLPFWFQDVQAWVALLAMLCLGIILIVQLFINTSVPLEQQLDLPVVEAVLAALVGFYFGARS
jgi:hypothetical protein